MPRDWTPEEREVFPAANMNAHDVAALTKDGPVRVTSLANEWLEKVRQEDGVTYRVWPMLVDGVPRHVIMNFWMLNGGVQAPCNGDEMELYTEETTYRDGSRGPSTRYRFV